MLVVESPQLLERAASASDYYHVYRPFFIEKFHSRAQLSRGAFTLYQTLKKHQLRDGISACRYVFYIPDSSPRGRGDYSHSFRIFRNRLFVSEANSPSAESLCFNCSKLCTARLCRRLHCIGIGLILAVANEKRYPPVGDKSSYRFPE